MKRLAALRALLTVPIIALIVVTGISAAPVSTAHACLPCNCTDIRSLNCFGPFHLYTQSSGEVCDIEVWLLEGGRGRRALRARSADLNRLPEFPETNLLVRERGVVALYKLTSGEYQVNVGPDADGKVYVVNWTGCPADNVRETNFEVARPGA